MVSLGIRFNLAIDKVSRHIADAIAKGGKVKAGCNKLLVSFLSLPSFKKPRSDRFVSLFQAMQQMGEPALTGHQNDTSEDSTNP
jgi:hypothetical protein